VCSVFGDVIFGIIELGDPTAFAVNSPLCVIPQHSWIEIRKESAEWGSHVNPRMLGTAAPDAASVRLLSHLCSPGGNKQSVAAARIKKSSATDDVPSTAQWSWDVVGEFRMSDSTEVACRKTHTKVLMSIRLD
jgi:hypothetical protein